MLKELLVAGKGPSCGCSDQCGWGGDQKRAVLSPMSFHLAVGAVQRVFHWGKDESDLPHLNRPLTEDEFRGKGPPGSHFVSERSSDEDPGPRDQLAQRVD